jgi:hypothetical protein
VTLPLAAPYAIAKTGHLIEHRMNLRNHVLTVHDDGRSSGGAQSHVQNRSILRDIDLLTAEHRLRSRPQSGFLRKLIKELECFVGDPILGVIEEQAHGFSGHPLTALGIGREKVAEMRFPDLFMMVFQGLPCRPFIRQAGVHGFCSRCHFSSLHLSPRGLFRNEN